MKKLNFYVLSELKMIGLLGTYKLQTSILNSESEISYCVSIDGGLL